MVKYTEKLTGKNEVLRITDGFNFSFHKRLQDGKQHFKCTNNFCKCYIIFYMDGSIAVDKMQGRNDNCDTQTALVHQKMSNMLKRKAVDCLSDKPNKIIHRILTEDSTLDVTK